jgi:hypothetical protein
VSRRPAVARRAIMCIAVLSLAAAAACAKSNTPPPHTLPGALAKPLDSLSGEELYAFTRSLAFGGGADQDRKCKGASECNGISPRRTKVHVDAVNGQDSLSAIAVPRNGVIAIKALNVGANIEDLYGMKPGAGIEYFLVVLPGATDSTGRWRLEELDTTPGARRHSQVATGTLLPCWHSFVPGRANRANFYTCNDEHMAKDRVTRSGLALAAQDAPMWMDCAQGCCLATQP